LSRFSLFFEALDNEMAIDANVVERMEGREAKYVPIRPLKSIKWFKHNVAGRPTYFIFCFLFSLAYVPFVIVRALKYFKRRKGRFTRFSRLTLLLNANGKAVTTFSKVYESSSYVSFNLLKGEDVNSRLTVRTSDFLAVSDVFSVIYDCLAIIPKFFFSKYNFLDVAQLYISVDWFASYRALQNFLLENDVDEVFFSNHYDRWAVLFDGVFSQQTINLMQHGVLPVKGFIPHKLRNVDRVFLLSEAELGKLETFILNVEFLEFLIINDVLNTYDPKISNPTILIIGQPQSADRERALIKLLKNDVPEIYRFLKPHPVYGCSIYKEVLDLVELIDHKCFPKVDVAICYESTLGLEYERSGIPVIWWENRSPEELAEVIKKI
jgi:hypothetical protein